MRQARAALPLVGEVGHQQGEWLGIRGGAERTGVDEVEAEIASEPGRDSCAARASLFSFPSQRAYLKTTSCPARAKRVPSFRPSAPS
jgi:hypothetical protein